MKQMELWDVGARATWEHGVELAYPLNKAMDIAAGLDDPSSTRAAFELAEELDRLAKGHMRYGRVLGRYGMEGGRVRTPPYTELTELPDDLAFSLHKYHEGASRQNNQLGDQRAELSERLVAELDKAVNQLIGREVYVQGMNPSEAE